MTKSTRSTPLSSPADDAHERLRDLLPEYAMICLQRPPIDSEWRALESHLTACSACRDELDDLLQLLDDTYSGTLPSDDELPEIDLSYLPPWSTSDHVGERLAVVRRTLVLARQISITFTDMLVEAMHGPHFAGEFRSEDGEHSRNLRATTAPSGAEDPSLPREFTYQVHGTPPDDLDIAIDLTLTDPHEALYRMRIMLVDPQDPFAQDNHRISLSYEAQRLEGLTDTHGSVTFNDIPYAALAQIQLTIHLRP